MFCCQVPRCGLLSSYMSGFKSVMLAWQAWYVLMDFQVLVILYFTIFSDECCGSADIWWYFVITAYFFFCHASADSQSLKVVSSFRACPVAVWGVYQYEILYVMSKFFAPCFRKISRVQIKKILDKNRVVYHAVVAVLLRSWHYWQTTGKSIGEEAPFWHRPMQF